MQKKVSIITASYNYENYIKETIESVIAQTYQDWEMIIVDDGSIDNSVEIINSYCEKDSRIKLYQHENGQNRGLSETIKLGIKKAESEWIVFLESDDTITPDYLEEKFKIVEKYPQTGFIYNNTNLFGDEERIQFMNDYFKVLSVELEKYSFPTNISESYEKFNPVPTFSCVMLKKKLFEGLDFNTPIKPWLDWYLWAQIAQKNEFYFIDKKLTNWRMHKDSYNSEEKTLLQRLRWEHLFYKMSKGSNIVFEILFILNFMRKHFIRIHFKQRKILFLDKWYQIGKIEN